ncbi:hypothetical protein EXIGLDRAFT_634587 [Exidia glandulosa HHB12029]|uniref:Chromo domain-containing protein n=1 Tax=Exidia glandulosa HHB12029 TaxID=1314781 RepID=A0A166MJS6_EXIGL|nr:hypothetical protein EXIGLDRAFT_634587 [Exidia glandulosa HHB12029]
MASDDASDDEGKLWDAIEILDERGREYLINWDGTDPATGKQWEPTWVSGT